MVASNVLKNISTWKAKELQGLAVQIGIPSSGTKTALSSRLLEALSPRGTKDELSHNGESILNEGSSGRSEDVVLSIDMGIRNLAYCKLAIPRSPVLSPRSHYSEPTPRSDRATQSQDAKLTPKLLQWSRAVVSTADSQTKESFDPWTLASYANTLVTKLVFSQSFRPSTILIERQRFRTAGGHAVQEWTLRVNMFESMLWAVLESVRRSGQWNGKVLAVDPGAVTRWSEVAGRIGGDGLTETPSTLDGTKGKRRKTSRDVKQSKMSLVEKWLEDPGVLCISDTAENAAGKFLRKRRGQEKLEKAEKLDDMADALVQGVAWHHWQKNRDLMFNKLIKES